jgi:hypothetical protein
MFWSSGGRGLRPALKDKLVTAARSIVVLRPIMASQDRDTRTSCSASIGGRNGQRLVDLMVDIEVRKHIYFPTTVISQLIQRAFDGALSSSRRRHMAICCPVTRPQQNAYLEQSKPLISANI